MSMGEGKQSSSVVSISNLSPSPPQNPLLQIQSKFKELGIGVESWVSKQPLGKIQSRLKELEIGFGSWVSKQPLYVEAAVSTARGAAQGAVVGIILANWSHCLFSVPPLRPGLDPNSVSSYMTFGGPPLVRARTFAVLLGVNAGVNTVLKRLNRSEDMQCRMIASFGSGAIFSFVNGMTGSNQLDNMVTTGVVFLIAQGVTYKLLEKYMKTKGLSKNLDVKRRALSTTLCR